MHNVIILIADLSVTVIVRYPERKSDKLYICGYLSEWLDDILADDTRDDVASIICGSGFSVVFALDSDYSARLIALVAELLQFVEHNADYFNFTLIDERPVLPAI